MENALKIFSVIMVIIVVAAAISMLPEQVDNFVGQESDVSEASYIIYKDGDYSCLKDGMTGRITMRSEDASAVIQSAADLGGVVYICPGDYNISSDGLVLDNVTIAGAGASLVNLYNNNIYVQIMISGSNVGISDLSFNGSNMIYISNQASDMIENITIENVRGFTDKTRDSTFFIYAVNNGTVQNVNLINCYAESDTFGFANHGSASGLLRNITYEDCKSVKCGFNDRINEWVVGFDIREGGILDNVNYINCESWYAWESGFHFEAVSSNGHVTLDNCRSYYSGQKPVPLYGHNFMIAGNVTAIDCYSYDAAGSGFYILNKQGGQSVVIGCTDLYSNKGFHVAASPGEVIISDTVSRGAVVAYQFVDSYTNTTKALASNIRAFDSSRSSLYSANFYNLTINGAEFHNGAGDGFFQGMVMLGQSGSPLKNVVLSDVEIISNGALTYGLYINADNAKVDNCYIKTASSYGIYIYDGENVTITNIRNDCAKTNQIAIYDYLANNVFINDVLLNSNGFSAQGSISSQTLGNVVIGNDFINNGYWAPGNVLYTTRTTQQTIAAGGTSISFTHLMAYTPTPNVVITPLGNLGSETMWISSINATHITITISGALGSDLLINVLIFKVGSGY